MGRLCRDPHGGRHHRLHGGGVPRCRIGKYDASGKSNAIPGHSITLGALGVFILWFGWYGFNGAARGTVAEVAAIFSTTTLAAVAAAIAAMVTS